MDWKDYLADSSSNIAAYRKASPETAAGFTGLHKAALTPGALSVKEKELQALAIGVAQRCVDCIGFHVQAAAKAGATREEVVESVSVAVMMGGGPAYMYGVKALAAFDELCA